jgi:UDP-4-amino-4-deoxy-L-arabinose formyltransferase/UDP-glucuronic acid dehydrogenase (UDP-4-keto-hexauronic acid decarboxylating)
MRVAIIGRGEILSDTALRLRQDGHTIALVITAKEAPEAEITAEGFRTAAAAWGVPCVQTPRIEEAVETLRALPAIDIGVSLNYVSIIPRAFLEQFRLGVLNGHGGDLPRYRGNACQAWAILNGEDRVGLCVHRMVGGELDNGDIIARDYFPLTIETTITAVHAWMRQRTPALFSEALRRLAEDPSYVLERQSTDPADALRCYPRRPEDGRIDWRRPAIDILRLVNASNRPYAGAFCQLDGRKLVVWQASLAPAERFLAIPGQVTAIGDGFIDVAAGEGKLRLTQVETEDGIVSPDAIVRSLRQRLG